MLIYDWFFKQAVTEEQMNNAFAAVQSSMFNLMTDQLLVGIAQGGTTTQKSGTPDLHVTVGGPFMAYDQLGQRIYTAGDTIDMSVDSNSVSTAVSGAGNSKYVSLFIQFTRALSNPQIDGNGASIYYNQAESYQYVKVQGTEATTGTQTKPALINPGLLVADVLLAHGTTQILDSMINQTRMQSTFAVSQSPFSIFAGTVPGALSVMLTNLNNHVNGVSGMHPTTAINTTGSSYTGTTYSLAGGSGISLSTQIVGAGGLAPAIDSLETGLAGLTLSGPGLTIPYYSNAAALRAVNLADCGVGMTAAITSFGIYVFDAVSGTDNGVTCIKPHDASSFVGRWQLTGSDGGLTGNVANVPFGMTVLDTNGKVPLGNTYNQIAYMSQASGASGFGSTHAYAATPGDTSVHLFTPVFATIPAVQTGDIIIASMYYFGTCDASVLADQAQIYFAFGGTAQTTIAGYLPNVNASNLPTAAIPTHGYFRDYYTVGSNASSFTVGYAYQAITSSMSIVFTPLDYIVQVFRP